MYRVLGIDPGLTRCGWGVIEVATNRRARLVDVGVFRTDAQTPLELRLASIATDFDALLERLAPREVALERVFAQQNLPSVMGVAQVSGVVLAASARRGLSVGLHTPSEVKAAITGYGAAEKAQVGTMVARVLGLTEIPKPADAADALALALCHAWRQGMPVPNVPEQGAPGAALTPAQRAWRAAERGGSASVVRSRLKP